MLQVVLGAVDSRISSASCSSEQSVRAARPESQSGGARLEFFVCQNGR